jgi:hypothetical protein
MPGLYPCSCPGVEEVMPTSALHKSILSFYYLYNRCSI